jgi:hypothetical protein
MLLVGRIVKREEKPEDPMADTTYLIGVSATNLGKDVGDTIDLLDIERLRELKIPEWALSNMREHFPEAGFTNAAVRKQLEYWHARLLPRVLRRRRSG